MTDIDSILPATPRAQPTLLVVGIGASAGGLASFTAFFDQMPPDSGMAFVLVQHLDPQQPSLLPELLAPHTRMPVLPAADQMQIAPNHVYLIPPNTTLTIEHGALCLAAPLEARGHRMPIDHFFHSLAANQGARAVGIVLSGTGSDGTLGLVAIKQHGGMTLVQAPDSAQYDAMPRSAIARGVADHILHIDQIPAALDSYARAEAARPQSAEAHDLAAAVPDELWAISAILRQATGHDFSHYKPATLLRRIARRMQALHCGTLADYIVRLRADAQEVDLLFHDFLISVTHFFRDPAAFDSLASLVLPNLFRGRGADARVRVWVPGCATGEEAYTIAILLSEQLAGLASPPLVQVFATDIDELALGVARQGRYDSGIAAHVSAERLARNFTQQGQTYQVTKAIRELCLFSAHNLISDPPFGRMDLIVCRNVLIYFDADLQRRLVPVLQYALAPGGYLFLGASESIAPYDDVFQIIDKQHRIFQRLELPARTYVDFPLAEPRRRPTQPLAAAPRAPAALATLGTALDGILLKHYAPPAAIVDARGAVVAFSGRTAAYLQPPAGPPNMDLLAMIHPQLRLALHTAMRAAERDHTATICKNLSADLAGGVQQLNLIVRPLAELGLAAGLLLIVFQELGPPATVEQAQTTGQLPPTDEPIAQQLAEELQSTRGVLEATIAELQEATAEFASANEELLSINEEQQSANEELQTSREEIQSINEELQTVNAELSRKVDELDRVNGDLQNLLVSTQIPALFLHPDGRIARFTPVATELFRLIASDVGRPITDITARFHNSDLMALVSEVLRTLAPYEAPVRQAAGDTWWIMRIRPYRTIANVIDGVVITFADITNLKLAEAERERLLAAVQRARLFAERIVETVRQPLLVLNAEQRVQVANRAFYQTFEVTPAETEQLRLGELGERQWDRPEVHALLDAIREQPAAAAIAITQAFPRLGVRTMQLSARLIEQPIDGATTTLLAIEDITERAQAAAVLQQTHTQLEERVQERTHALATANAALRAEIGERARAEQARQLLLQQLVTAQEEERRRIARELHDQMGQDLTALMLGLKTLRDAAPADSPTHSRLEQVQGLAIKIGREVRSLALHLRPPALDELGLLATLANEVELWSARTLIAVDFQSIGWDDRRLPAPLEITLYRVAQEALTNVLKHAQATRVSLIIERRADAVHMIVEDNGVGFNAEPVQQTAQATQRLGLVGMAERVAHVGGTLTIEATPRRGTTVFVRIPHSDGVQGGSYGETPDLSGR